MKNIKFILFCIFWLIIICFFSCATEVKELPDEDFMEKYIKQAHEKFHQDSIKQGLIKE